MRLQNGYSTSKQFWTRKTWIKTGSITSSTKSKSPRWMDFPGQEWWSPVTCEDHIQAWTSSSITIRSSRTKWGNRWWRKTNRMSRIARSSRKMRRKASLPKTTITSKNKLYSKIPKMKPHQIRTNSLLSLKKTTKKHSHQWRVRPNKTNDDMCPLFFQGR